VQCRTANRCGALRLPAPISQNIAAIDPSPPGRAR
jgi:hypothetical protein